MADLKTVAALAFSREGRKIHFLLLRSAKNGHWDPPKGKMDPGETEIETATRELFEETGIHRAGFVPGFRETTNYQVDNKGELRLKETVFFLCEAEMDGIRLSPEHTEAHLATLEEAEMLLHRDEVRAVFRKAHAALEGQKI